MNLGEVVRGMDVAMNAMDLEKVCFALLCYAIQDLIFWLGFCYHGQI